MTTLIQQYFSDSAHRFPEKAAIHCDDKSTTYRESDGFTNAVANELKATGISRGAFIPFFMAKGINAIHAILAILKSDCAYVPISVDSPGARLESIIQACRAKIIITDAGSEAALRERLPPELDCEVFVIDAFHGGDTSEPRYDNLSIDIAYVLFTSGSTGTPKGVMIPHKAIIDYIDWCVTEYELDHNDIIANHAPLNFDNSTFDLYTAFKTGGELHLVHEEVNNVITSLIKWIRARNVTTFFCVPSVLSLLLRARRLKVDSFPALRHVICAGEVLRPDVLRAWMALYPHIQFTNMYGPTEITVDCSYYRVRELPAEDARHVPIGKARPNMELFVREESGTLSQAVGAQGELLVRGTSVAYGYLSDPDRTSTAFIQNPYNLHFHDPLYCTGDLVEIDPRGDFLFLGRADDQIKYLGYRIELGEIEVALSRVPGILEAVVVFRDSAKIEETSIGALVNAPGMRPIDVTGALGGTILPYMLPARIVMTPGPFPRTSNGKYDRKRINAMVFDQG